mgnify:CR=1 FL=1|jgi:hypothetical protein
MDKRIVKHAIRNFSHLIERNKEQLVIQILKKELIKV